jgi:hypothetical protein
MKIKYLEKRENYTMIRLRRSDNEPGFNEVNKWCAERGVGKLVNMDTFAFKNESEMSMFYLKWID